MQNIQDMLFDYMKNMLFHPDIASLCIEQLPQEYRKMGAGLKQFCEWAVEANQFAGRVAKGDLSIENVPSVENVLAANMKALQADLIHMTWQTQQIAKGDYRQKMEYLGDFAIAFNEMTRQLQERATALENERNLFTAFAEHAKEFIVVIDEELREVVFANKGVRENQNPYIQNIIYNQKLNQLSGCDEHHTYVAWEYQYMEEDKKISDIYFEIHSMYVIWDQRPTQAHLILDITNKKKRELETQLLALRDPLTGSFNRRYAMDYLETRIDKQELYALAFIDIDHLKYCNDTYGHAAGDAYIIQIVNALNDLVEDGIVCRVGGDEFILIERDKTEEIVSKKLDAARKKIKKEFIGEKKKIRKSFSYGVVGSDSQETVSGHRMLSIADERMYAYKVRHKKRVMVESKDTRLI